MSNLYKEAAEMSLQLIFDAMPEEKCQVWRNACIRAGLLTSYYGLGFSELTVYKEGYYWKAEGCRSTFAVYMRDNDGTLELMRKPRDSELSYLWSYRWLNEMPKAAEAAI